MSSKREQIITTIFNNLKTVSGISATDVFRSRVFPFDVDSLPKITLEPQNEQIDADTLGITNFTLTIQISLFVSGEIPDQSADQIMTSIYQVMMNDTTINGLAMNLNPKSINWNFEDGQKPLAQINYIFEIFYRI